MANIALVNSAQFQPFSYQELVAPVAHQQQVLDDLAEQYDKLSQQADVLEALGSNETDKKSRAYIGYKSYSDSLREEVDNLYRNGLNAASRQRLSDLRRRYNSEIVPIQNAYTKREKEALMQQEARIRNPYIRFTRDASTTRLEDYMANPELGYGVVDLKNVAGDMAEMAKNLSKQIRAGVNIEGIDPYTKRIISQHGLDPNLISEWANNPNASPALTNMMNQVLAAHGLNTQDFADSPNGASILREAIGAAQRGAWNAVGEDKEDIMEDFASRLAAKTAAELDAYRGKKAIDAEGAPQGGTEGVPGETFAISFNDPESAGNSMKRRMAEETARFLMSSRNPEAKKYLDKWKGKGGIEAAKKDWMENGINGSELKNNLYYSLGNHLRENVTGNENIINAWRSPYKKSWLSAEEKKDWKDFDKESSTGYRVNAVQLNDKSTVLASYLERVLSRNARDGKIKLYDIEKIGGDNNYQYSANSTSISDLPHTSNGKEIDYKRIKRALLSNGDYLLYWIDDNGNTVEKVLKRSDIGKQSVRDWSRVKAGVNAAVSKYNKGELTEEQYDELLRRIGENDMVNSYMDMQEIDVEDYKIGKQNGNEENN